MQAALEVLTESGYESFTTSVVASRAGVSKGALFQHFPCRESLVVALVKHVFDRQRGRFARAQAAVRGSQLPERVRAALVAVWDVVREPEYLAAQQIYAAARTNERLARTLRPIAQEQAERTALVGDELLASLGARRRPELRACLSAVFYALEGLAGDEAVCGASEAREAMFGALEKMLLRAIAEEVRH